MATPILTNDFLDFFIELASNNNRDWFQANKSRYKEQVEQPFKNLVESLITSLQKYHPSLDQIQAKDCIFRIYRDTRFSKDKTPYKTHMAALIGPGGRKDKTSPGMYIQLGAEDARLYSGAHMLDKDQLMALRSAIARDLKGFKKARTNKKFVETFGEILGEKNKRLPSDFTQAAEQEPLIFNKSFYFFKKWPAEIILEKDFTKTLLETYKKAAPVNEFLFAGFDSAHPAK